MSKVFILHGELRSYPSDAGLEGAVSDELEEVEITEEVTEVTDSLRRVEDMMYGSTMDPVRLCFRSVKLGGWKHMTPSPTSRLAGLEFTLQEPVQPPCLWLTPVYCGLAGTLS